MVIGRKRNYIITNKGRQGLKEEHERLRILVREGEKILGDNLCE